MPFLGEVVVIVIVIVIVVIVTGRKQSQLLVFLTKDLGWSLTITVFTFEPHSFMFLHMCIQLTPVQRLKCTLVTLELVGSMC